MIPALTARLERYFEFPFVNWLVDRLTALFIARFVYLGRGA
jgi:hypothetical protein